MNADARNTHHFYNKSLRPVARALRKNMTKAEACLWKYVLRAGKMKGYTFNRQRPIVGYVADFFSKELSLVIEVDGVTHLDAETCRRDRSKERELERRGYKVKRFSDEEVLRHIDAVRRALESCVEEREKELAVTSPSPPRGGGQRGALHNAHTH